MTKQQLFIYFLVGIMLFSAIGTGILLISQSSSSNDINSQDIAADTSEPGQVCQASPEVANQPGNPVGEWPITSESVTKLVVTDLRVGTGAVAEEGSCITAHYRLSGSDGVPVDGNDTFATGQPFTAQLTPGALIAGWIEGIPGMREGGVRRLIVPSDLGYSDGKVLIFDVELVKVEF